MDDMRVLNHEVLEVDVREITLNGEAIDLGAGGEAQIRLRGHIGRKAGRDRSFASWTSHSLEHKCPEGGAPVRRYCATIYFRCSPKKAMMRVRASCAEGSW